MVKRLGPLLVVVVLCALGMIAVVGASIGAPPGRPQPTSRPAAGPPVSPLARWHRAAPRQRDLPPRIELPPELLPQVRRQYEAGITARRERHAILAVHPADGRVLLMNPTASGRDRVRNVAALHAAPLPDGWFALGDFHTHTAPADDPRHVHGFSPADLRTVFTLGASRRLRIGLLADADRIWMIVLTDTSLAAWPAVQEHLASARLSGYLAAAAIQAEALEIPPEARTEWISHRAGLAFNTAVAKVTRRLPVYFDATGRRRENVRLGGYGLYVGDLADGVLVRQHP
jgi:hypothetical protein